MGVKPKTVHFYKYSAFGNNFVIVDELKKKQLRPGEIPALIQKATNEFTGIGADALIVIQPNLMEILKEIYFHYKYWLRIPKMDNLDEADIFFRMFEPDGNESLMCGNGLVCVAYHLYRFHQKAFTRILTEIPSPTPRIREVQLSPPGFRYRAKIGHATLIPSYLIKNQHSLLPKEPIGYIKHFPVTFQAKRGKEKVRVKRLISGFTTYTGEPHLVIFPSSMEGEESEVAEIFDLLLGPHNNKEGKENQADSLWLFHQIGMHFNAPQSPDFPHGLNVNFARIVSEKGIIDFRTFERGIRKETLSCGTGSIAIAEVAYQLGLIRTNRIKLFPQRSRWYSASQNPQLTAIRDPQGDWWLETEPRLILEGNISL